MSINQQRQPSRDDLLDLNSRQAKVMNQFEKAIEELRWENIQLKRQLTRALNKLEKAEKTIVKLEEELRIARLPKNSSNSSLPPSTDLYKPVRNKNRSLRKKTGRKSGGQSGHKGKTLKFCNDLPDKQISHSVEHCRECGRNLSDIKGEEKEIHQVVDIAIPKRVLTNHIVIEKRCTCGHCNRAEFPEGALGVVNYGNRLRGLVANLSVRQYISYNRTVEFIDDLFGISMSEGTVKNMLDQFVDRAKGIYEEIRQQVYEAKVKGSDETSVKVNGRKDWFHTYQTSEHTFIGHHPSRGSRAQKIFFPKGFPDSILVSDCFAMQLATPAATHQLCHAHLARELNAFYEAHPQEKWPQKMKALFHEATESTNNPLSQKKINNIKNRFTKLIAKDLSKAPGKIPAFWKRMNKHKDKVFTFLDYPNVPSDNNGSERAIRNVKVKQKVSGQFRSEEGAKGYAIIRSIIDTLVKQDKNVHEGLAEIAALGPAP